jgi:lysophospholipase L1-like esterase
VQPVNDRLRTVVPQEGAVLVDTWQALGGAPDPYVDFDGLHLTTAGYARVADAFFAAMRTRFETTAPPVADAPAQCRFASTISRALSRPAR